ncbi:MAG: shikimate/quinate 5-dehydrogenase [Bacillota bacterium]|nr:MAG: shikimate/quinate 5-dehydrogenase [Bacillota bacterium]MBS3951027.1 SDR family NAD(P)-dependent oxidoreductase [Peptococcaceae bacterium]
MRKFAFIIHPVVADDVARKFKFTASWSDDWKERLVRWMPSLKVSRITGVLSEHAEVEGYFIACPLTSRQLLGGMSAKKATEKIIRAGRIAEKLGAEIVGLGALTSVVGDAGITIAEQLNIGVTTGNSYTVATALMASRLAAEKMGVDIADANVAIVGASGSIGQVCARLLSKEAGSITLVARNVERLQQLAQRIKEESGVVARVSSDVRASLAAADIVITVTSSIDFVVDPLVLKPGAIVCDVARPRDVSEEVARLRDDILIVDGGVVEVPGDVDFRFNFGFPPRMAYACMAETMILALEGKVGDFSLGREIRLDQVEEITRLAEKHGFKLAGFRTFERAVTDEKIAEIRSRAESRRKKAAIAGNS